METGKECKYKKINTTYWKEAKSYNKVRFYTCISVVTTTDYFIISNMYFAKSLGILNI